MKPIRTSSLTIIVAACLVTSAVAADESTSLAVLASAGSNLEQKANACDELGRVGTAKSVPVLASLLSDLNLHDYARDGLERINDPTAGAALLDSLTTLKSSQRIGAIISLGDRGDHNAVPALTKIAQSEAETTGAVNAALTSLAQIATADATKTIFAALTTGKGKSKITAAKAALLAAQRLEKKGDKKTAARLREAVSTAGLPAHIKKAAGQ